LFSEDLPLGVGSKETIERTRGKWIIEASEIRGLRDREVEQLKHFLSRQVDGPVRLAYARLSAEVPRQFVLIGTTNMTGYLRDQTGGRRFWPVQTQQFDVEAIRRDRDQLWAEAASREAYGESIRLDPKYWKAAGREQEARRVDDPWEAILEPLFENPDIWESSVGMTTQYVRSSAIWEALGVKADARNNHHAARVAAIAQRFGFTKKDPIIHRLRVRGWAFDPSCSSVLTSTDDDADD
jgi:predicted P-loop ATPase